METFEYGDLIAIEIHWDDLTDKAKDELRKILKLDKDDNNNWDIVPIVTLDIQKSTIEEEG